VAQDILKAIDVTGGNAAMASRCLVAADQRCVEAHGIYRFPSYPHRSSLGALGPKAELTVKGITPVITQVDVNNGWE
jgi:LDH2 family malate/lactate/ureidoglycolate dehydrogenase